MKIALISTPWLRTPPFKYGGTEAVVSYLTEELTDLGHDVTLFATGDSITKAKLWSWFEQPVTDFNLLDEVLHVVKAYEHIVQSNFDIVHNHTYSIGSALLSLSPCSSLTTYHSVRTRRLWYYYSAFASNHRYVAISENQRQSMPELNWIGTIYNAIPVDLFPFSSEKDDYLLFIGKIAPWKSPHYAIQVAQRLKCRLKIAGPIHEAAYFEREIAPHIDGKMIEYVGEVDFVQKTSLYKHASALLMTGSWEEPFGMVMIEALACGTPVVAFHKGATPEIIVNGVVGYLGGDVTEVVEAVQKIRNISSHACREYVEQKFHVRTMANQYIALYQQILNHQQTSLNKSYSL